jgi:hypothetical protein
MDYRNPYWSMKRHCARLQQFVKVIKEHADAEAKASLLTDLSVTMGLVGAIRYQQDMDARNIFALEELAPLRGIENVDIGGENSAAMPDWFAKCLQCCIQRRGGDPKEQDYSLVEVKQKKKGAGFAKKPK